MFKNIIGHLKTVLIHKYWVFIYACKLGIPWQDDFRSCKKVVN